MDKQITELKTILDKFGIDVYGPDSSEITDRKKIVYQVIDTWTIEYDGPTMKCLQATHTNEDKTY